MLAEYRDRLHKLTVKVQSTEAVTFHFFRSNLDAVQVNEDPNKGGVDFRGEIGYF